VRLRFSKKRVLARVAAGERGLAACLPKGVVGVGGVVANAEVFGFDGVVRTEVAVLVTTLLFQMNEYKSLKVNKKTQNSTHLGSISEITKEGEALCG
jgi:hypothetical protein